jgi:hypothetical protein
MARTISEGRLIESSRAASLPRRDAEAVGATAGEPER